MADIILQGKEVSKSFGGVHALRQVDFEVLRGEVFGIIGPNGAGKTTLLNCISGLFPLTKGEIYFEGHKISSLKPHQITKLGIGRTFQVVRPFEGMTVRENVAVGAIFGRSEPKVGGKDPWEIADEAIKFVGLSGKENALVPNLPVAQRKRVELARAIAMQPKLLLLDEVMAGLNPKEVESVMEMIQRIASTGTTVILIEHIMKAVMGISDRVMVLHNGQRICLGTPEEVSRNEEVIKAYLGERYLKLQEEGDFWWEDE